MSTPPPSTATTPLPSLRHPCLRCQQRKVKCDRNQPCSHCVKARMQCVGPNTDQPRKRKKRFPEAELLARLRRYEAYFKEQGLDPEAVGFDARHPQLENSTAAATTDYIKSSPKSLKNGNLLSDQFRDIEDILQGSSGDETPVTKTFDAREPTTDGYDLVFEPHKTESLVHLHPSPLHGFRLWQIFLDNVHPLVKILHAPTVQQRFLDASADLSSIAPDTEALMFAVYAVSIASIRREDCMGFFAKERGVLLAQYQGAARKALTNAGLLRSSNLVVLQAFALYLLSTFQGTSNPRSLFCLTGIAIRIAQRMGLDRDGTILGLPPFETEMRRRLWWQLLLIDTRVAEVSGSQNPVDSYSWSTKPPSNVNDNDLFEGMKDAPIETERFTEVGFVLLRYELFVFNRELQSSSPTNSREKTIDAFEAHLESKYLKHCDPSAPVHLISILMARMEIWKLRSGLFGSQKPTNLRQTSQTDQETIFAACLRVMEFHNTMLATESIRKFVWNTSMYPPFAAYIFLLCGLRTRTSDELADRAWSQLSQHAENQERHKSWNHVKPSSPFKLAIANLTVSAWEARERAQSRFQIPVQVPGFISDLRDRLRSERPQIANENPDISLLFGNSESIGRMPGLDLDMDAFFSIALPYDDSCFQGQQWYTEG